MKQVIYHENRAHCTCLITCNWMLHWCLHDASCWHPLVLLLHVLFMPRSGTRVRLGNRSVTASISGGCSVYTSSVPTATHVEVPQVLVTSLEKNAREKARGWLSCTR